MLFFLFCLLVFQLKISAQQIFEKKNIKKSRYLPFCLPGYSDIGSSFDEKPILSEICSRRQTVASYKTAVWGHYDQIGLVCEQNIVVCNYIKEIIAAMKIFSEIFNTICEHDMKVIFEG